MDISRTKLADGVFFNSVKVSKFKTIRLSATFVLPIDKNTIASDALLPMVLTHSCKKYPDFTMLNKHLDNMYGANISSHARKLGDSIVLTMAVSGIDNKYALNGEHISEMLAELLNNMFFDPKLENGTFCVDDLESEKNQLLDVIDAEFNDKRNYAISRMISQMYANEMFGTRYYGSREQVEGVSVSDIYNAWQKMLKTARTEIICIGNVVTDKIADSFKASFSAINREYKEVKTIINSNTNVVNEFSESLDLSQSKLVMGFRTSSAGASENADAARLMSVILGGCTTSKFFINIREKMSLCYYCASRYDRFKGLLIVDSGVQSCNVEKTKKEVINQLKALQNGELTDEEIRSAKLSMSDSFRSAVDTCSDIEAWYMPQILINNIISPSEASDRLFAITKEQIVAEAQKLRLDTVFTLMGN